MFEWLKQLFGGADSGTHIAKVRLSVPEQIKEVTEKIVTLEEKTIHLNEDLALNLEKTLENQKRLESIEANLQKMIEISESLIRAGMKSSGMDNARDGKDNE